jgi:hypothetical protein
VRSSSSVLIITVFALTPADKAFGRNGTVDPFTHSRHLFDSSSHLLFVPGSINKSDVTEAKRNPSELIELLTGDRLERSILFSQILMQELQSQTHLPSLPVFDWDYSTYVVPGVATRWLVVPRLLFSSRVFLFLHGELKAAFF